MDQLSSEQTFQIYSILIGTCHSSLQFHDNVAVTGTIMLYLRAFTLVIIKRFEANTTCSTPLAQVYSRPLKLILAYTSQLPQAIQLLNSEEYTIFFQVINTKEFVDPTLDNCMVPLSEDIGLRGFQPLDDFHSHLDWSTVNKITSAVMELQARFMQMRVLYETRVHADSLAANKTVRQ
jgi:hypothetical protein